MRLLGCLAATVPLVLFSLGPVAPATAQADPYRALAGYWSCTAAGGRHAERSYFILVGDSKLKRPAQIFGRQDTTEPDGAPSTSFERITENADGLGARIEAVGGTGKAEGTSPLAFSGAAYDNDKIPFSLTYEVDGNTLHRTTMRAGTTVSDERCTREPETPVDTACANPNVRARTLHAVEPNYPAAAIPARAHGVVQVLVTIDDRSRVLWASVLSSPAEELNDESVRAALDSTYRAEIFHCRPIAAQYIFSIDYSYR